MSFLSDIIDVKKEEVKILRKKNTFAFYRDSEFFEKEKLSLSDSIRNAEGIALIAEVKKASPSKGIIRTDFNHMKIAETYLRENTAGISVLTDKTFFHGDINFLKEIASIKSAPLLRKDFILDEHQVWEAKSNGADAVLLISEILSPGQINDLTHAAIESGLEVLLEMHSAGEIEKIDFSLNRLIGINNRDLKTFEVNIDTTLRLLEKLPSGINIVSESGFSTKEDIARLRGSGVKAILAGEHFMRAADIRSSVREFLEWCAYEG